MTLDEFVESELRNIAAFRRFWINSRKNNAEHFPLEMEAGEWDEQFHMWIADE